MSPPVTLRPATEQDDAFLYELFKSVRMPDFAQVPLAPEQLEGLMKMQYAGQKFSYSTQYPGPGHDIVLLAGAPAGRIWVNRSGSEHLLVDIALLPEFQNRGIGATLLQDVIAAAKQAGVPLKCSVAVTNPGSLRFHQRLGFQIVSQDMLYYELERQP
jgi:ribosomal protein S18 acetylase RimI-like enzyme